jgi:hypothetical protein
MIVFELICSDRHRFEGWFASGDDFDGQKARGMLSCPVCSDSSIEKLLTAKIGTPEILAAHGELPVPAKQGERPRNFNELIDYVLMNTENVGKNFPGEARRIHRNEIPHRNIRGVATHEETRELLEEGIAVLPLPIPGRSDWH